MSDTKRIAELTARIAELGEELARVKEESLRIVYDGDVIWCYEMGKRMLAFRNADIGVMIHDPNYRNWYTTTGNRLDHMAAFRVQPVRLERWT